MGAEALLLEENMSRDTQSPQTGTLPNYLANRTARRSPSPQKRQFGTSQKRQFGMDDLATFRRSGSPAFWGERGEESYEDRVAPGAFQLSQKNHEN